jgi:hypothetical protein
MESIECAEQNVHEGEARRKEDEACQCVLAAAAHCGTHASGCIASNPPPLAGAGQSRGGDVKPHGDREGWRY